MNKIIALLLLFLLLGGCRNTADLPSTPPATVTNGTAVLTGSETAGCRDAVPEDRRFPLPPWKKTNFCIHSVSYDEFKSGGVSKDRIPSIDAPVFQTVEEAEVWLAGVEPVIVLAFLEEARAYPLQVLVWHEIVNDVVAGVPILVTYCPLCNSGLVFERTVDGRVLDFGTTGNIRNADLVMYDRQTESWWQQFTGEALVGDFTGMRLTILPSQITSFSDFKSEFPTGQVLFPDTGYERLYGETPYVNYDSLVNPRTGFLDGEADARLQPKMRVLALDIEGAAIAYPYDLLSERGTINDTINSQPLVIFWKGGTTSALYSVVIAESKDVGSAAAFSRELACQIYTFTAKGDLFIDDQTGTTWNLFGTAVDGPLAGEQLTSLNGHEFLWFAWAAFRPDTALYRETGS